MGKEKIRKGHIMDKEEIHKGHIMDKENIHKGHYYGQKKKYGKVILWARNGYGKT